MAEPTKADLSSAAHLACCGTHWTQREGGHCDWTCCEHDREEDGEDWVEWGVRRTRGDVGSVAFFDRDYRTARKCAKDWPGTLVCRTVMAGAWVSGGSQP